MLRQTVGGASHDYVPRAQFEQIVRERDELRRALSLLNAAVRLGQQRTGLSATKLLDHQGMTFDLAMATTNIIDSVRGTGE